MPFDPQVPIDLKATQEWFGSIISVPLEKNDSIRPQSPRGRPIELEAVEKILPSPTLKPHERIQIYNQQYWWRLINTLQKMYPLLIRLFGYTDFNQSIAKPFLEKYPSGHWSLDFLGDRLPRWIQEEYQFEDKALVLAAAEVDLAFHSLFFKPMLPLFAEIDSTLSLQPHVQLFQHAFDIFTFRQQMLQQEVEYWIDHPFPELTHQKTCTLLFRLRSGVTAWKTIDEAEYLLLQRFQNGSTVDTVCEWLEEQPTEIRSPAETNLQNWFREWTLKGLLTNSITTESTENKRE